MDAPASAFPYVFTSAGILYSAFRLEYVIGLTVLGVESGEHLQSLAKRHAEFVTCLINGGDARLTYDLHYIAEPVPDGRQLRSYPDLPPRACRAQEGRRIRTAFSGTL